MSEEDAMVAFSSAKLNGVKIMELPDQDPSKPKEAKMSDQMEIAEF